MSVYHKYYNFLGSDLSAELSSGVSAAMDDQNDLGFVHPYGVLNTSPRKRFIGACAGFWEPD